MVDEYNASQTKVKVRAELQGASYEELLRKYEQAIPTNALPNIIVAEDTATQFLVDSGTVLPAQSCFDADGLIDRRVHEAAVNHFTTKGALWPGTASISDLLTYYNKNHFRRAGLDPERGPADARRRAHDGREDQGRRRHRRPRSCCAWTRGSSRPSSPAPSSRW